MPAWPVSIGYFEPGTENKDAVPVYELTFLFFENGVSRKLFIDYGEFAIQGEIKEITFLEPGKCEQQQGARLASVFPERLVALTGQLRVGAVDIRLTVATPRH